MDNTPIYGCNGCRTTGGRMSCYQHGQTTYNFGRSVYYPQVYGEDEALEKEISRINYGKVLVPVR